MELKPGYKRTEVGVVPDEWEIKPLKLILSKGRLGGNYPNQDMEAEYPLMKMGNIARGYFDLKKVEYIVSAVKPDPTHRLARGDVLFNTRNTLDLVGKVALWRDELPVAYYNSNLMRLEFDPKAIASSEYASYALNTAGCTARLRALATGTTSVAAIYTRDLMELPFVVPRKAEQRAIAMALSDVDALIGELDKLIAKKRDLKQAAMQQLLTGQTRLPGFSGEWEVKRLDELGRWTGGMTPSMQNPAFWESGVIPWISSGDVKVPRLYSTASLVTERAIKEKATTLVPERSIVVVMRSGILRKYFPVAMNMIPMAVNQDIKAILPRKEIHADFLLHSLTHSGERILSRCLKFGTTVESIELPWLKSFTVSIPQQDEQIAIATVLSDMDDEIEALEARRDKTHALKQGMMQELLTGRIRLV
ncbi:MAG TPA: hypothetical protein DDW98_04885 [Gammaproteobacteria bacterium]|nr:hypothetical protein [Gammaproteobacteria bacterium]